MAPNLLSAFGAKNCSCSFICMNVNDQDDCMETWTHKDRLDRLKFLYDRLGRLPTIETIIWKPGFNNNVGGLVLLQSSVSTPITFQYNF